MTNSKIQDFMTNWETNEKLSLRQRETYRYFEDVYLHERFSRKVKNINTIKTEETDYIFILFQESIYAIVGFNDTHVLCDRCGEKLIFEKNQIKQTKEGSRIWELSFSL